jgi:hypothetical protein
MIFNRPITLLNVFSHPITFSFRTGPAIPKGVFGSVDIHWLAGNIHFSDGYPLFGLEDEVVRDSQI